MPSLCSAKLAAMSSSNTKSLASKRKVTKPREIFRLPKVKYEAYMVDGRSVIVPAGKPPKGKLKARKPTRGKAKPAENAAKSKIHPFKILSMGCMLTRNVPARRK